MTETIIPITSPFWSTSTLGDYSPPSVNRTWVGAYPYLDTADTDTSYGNWNGVGDLGAGVWMGTRLAAWTPPGTVTGARMEFQGRTTTNSRVHVILQGPTSWRSFPLIARRPIGVWESFTDQLDVADDTYGFLGRMVTDLAAGAFEVLGNYDGGAFAFSMLRLVVITGGVPPLRQVQRDDGLGRSVVRARGGTSVQRSIRQRGYR
jgi:hypothetical protein